MSEQPRKKTQFKHKKIANKILKGMDKIKAYKTEYPNAKDITAETGVSRILSSEFIKQHMSQALDKQGLGLIELNKALKPLIDDPTKPIVIKDQIVQVEDKRLKLEAIKEGYKLHKLTEGNSINIDNRSITFNHSSQDLKELSTIAKTIQDLSTKLETSKITGEIEAENIVDVSGVPEDEQIIQSDNKGV